MTSPTIAQTPWNYCKLLRDSDNLPPTELISADLQPAVSAD